MSERMANSMKQTPLFIPYIVAGDPTPDATVDLALMLEESGASALELGIPYSDPLADGPTIQRAAKRALDNQMTMEKAMKLVKEMRTRGLEIPVIIFTYYNLLLQLGESYFFTLMKENDIDGLLVPDLPFEESQLLRERCLVENIAYISLIAPTTSKDRLTKMAREATGFLYAVSSLGVTGEITEMAPQTKAFLETVQKEAKVPVAVGFGISSPEQVAHYQEVTDGVIIGSAIVRPIEENKALLADPKRRKEGVEKVKESVLHLLGDTLEIKR